MLYGAAALSPKPTPSSIGRAGEEAVESQIENSGGQILGRNITVDTPAARTRPDMYVRRASGANEFVEVKTGPAAKLSPNQRAAFPQIEAGGAIPRGGNAQKAGLAPGNPLGPTPVRVINVPRPAGPPHPLPVLRKRQENQ